MKEIISIKTDYSILESMIKIPCLISYAVENGINTLGIVDNNLGYVAEVVKLCNKNIGFNGKFYTFPYFCCFMLKKYLQNFDKTHYCNQEESK